MNLRQHIIAILRHEGWDDERKADEIVRAAQDCFQPLDAEMWDS